MDILKFTTGFYGRLHNYGMPVWVLAPLRRAVRIFANKVLPKYLNTESALSKDRRSNLIVSFTSFPARINDVWKVVECLKRQTVLPEKIILWLSKEQFSDPSMIPDNLSSREDDLFEIRMVEGDIRSHKKYYYVMQEFPGKDFITSDDDIFYDPFMIERLLEASEKYPKCVIANHSSHIQFGNDGQVLPYSEWVDDEYPYADHNRLQIGVGGVFYPNGSLHDMVLRKDIFMSLTPLADDIWLNAMARLKGTNVVQSGKAILNIEITNASPSLSSVNNGIENMNDIQIMKLKNFLINNGFQDIYFQS